MHAVMAAGFAGGIGLSGGACGALAAAIWITGMKGSRDGTARIGFKNPEAVTQIARFLKYTGSKLECSEIVGRKFANIDDHAAHLRAGGCAKLIDLLAETPGSDPGKHS